MVPSVPPHVVGLVKPVKATVGLLFTVTVTVVVASVQPPAVTRYVKL